MSRLRLFAVAAGLALVPSLGIAQGNPPAPQTHTVKKGDTLWGIAKLYFSDPFLWPEIYRVNTDVVEDPHWIYPGEVLRIPDIAALQQKSRDEVAATQPVRQAPPPAEAAPAQAAPVQPVVVPRTSARASEYLASPFAGPVGGPAGAGRIVAAAERDSAQTTGGVTLLNRDLLVIGTPAGIRAVKGDRFLVYRVGSMLSGHGQVVEPVGLVQVEDAGNAAGGKVLASLRQMFQRVQVGDGLIPLDTLVPREGVYPLAVPPTLSTRVIWLQSDPILPSVGAYLIVDLTSKDGVVTGDQISLLRPRGRDAAGKALPDELLGVAQVLRVTQFGTSAIIVQANNSGIAIGTPGRVTAKMP